MFILPAGGSAGSSGRGVRTDAQGYFVSYYPNETSEYSVIVKYEGVSVKSRWFRLKEGQRYDELVLVLRDLETHRVQQNNRVKARLSVWLVNPDNGHAYKRIKCDSWEDAKAKAAAENAYLVTINDEAEQKWLEAVYPQKMFFWIGLRVPKKEAAWQWDNGEPLTYTNWINAQQPESVSVGEGEVPVAMEFFLKRWTTIGPESPFLPMVKHAILEKEDTLAETDKVTQ